MVLDERRRSTRMERFVVAVSNPAPRRHTSIALSHPTVYLLHAVGTRAQNAKNDLKRSQRVPPIEGHLDRVENRHKPARLAHTNEISFH